MNRKALYCDRKDCAEIGRWSPVLVIFAKHHPKGASPARAQLELVVCDGHKASATLDDFVSDEGWEQIVQALASAGKAKPSRKKLVLAWTEVLSGEAIMQLAPPSKGDGTDLSMPAPGAPPSA